MSVTADLQDPLDGRRKNRIECNVSGAEVWYDSTAISLERAGLRWSAGTLSEALRIRRV